jgi:hypothetical protein
VVDVTQATWGAAWRNKAQAAAAIGVSLMILATAVVLFIVYLRLNSDLSAFRSAVNCTTPAEALDSKSCRYDGPARIVATNRAGQLHATIAFDSLPGRTLTATFYTNDEPSPELVAVGAPTTAQVWKGSVTELAGKVTVDSPENPPTTQIGYAAPVIGVAGVILLFLSVMMARAAWRPRSASTR